MVIGIIALLVSILLPSLNQARESAKRVKRLSNLRQTAIAMTMDGNQHQGKLPMHKGHSGGWLWDIPLETRDQLVSNGMARDILYCPTAEDRNVDALWTFGNPGSPYAVAGYFFLNQRHPYVPAAPPASDTGWADGYPKVLAGGKTYQRRLTEKNASEKKLLTDATLSQNGDFYVVAGGFKAIPDQTHHIKGKGAKPYGGNVIFLDGHGEWRPFSEMKARGITGERAVLVLIRRPQMGAATPHILVRRTLAKTIASGG